MILDMFYWLNIDIDYFEQTVNKINSVELQLNETDTEAPFLNLKSISYRDD